jgi:MSHA biogenesis protein MshN
MSVINQVLQDLERRHAKPGAGQLGIAAVRATAGLPRTTRPRGALTLVAVAALVAASGVTVWLVPRTFDDAPAAEPEQRTPPAVSLPVPTAPGVADAASTNARDTQTRVPVRAERPGQERVRSGGAAASHRPQPGSSAPRPARAAQTSRPATPDASDTMARVAARNADAEVAPGAPSDRPAIERHDRPLAGGERAELRFREAMYSLRQGQTIEATAGFRSALEQDPTHVPARQALLALLLEQGNTAEAEALMREGLKASPSHVPYAMVLARLQTQRGDLSGAVATLETYRTAGRRNGDYLAMLAALLQRQGRHAEAAEEYAAALATGHPRGAWHMGQGISLRELGRADEAAAASYVERQLAALDRTMPR